MREVALNPYPSYRECVLPSLGNIPEHWSMSRAKYLFREVDDRSATGAEELLSVSHLTGVTPRREKNVTMFMAESNAGHKVCRPGDLVINTMWAWMAALGVSAYEGLVSPSYGVYRPLSDDLLPGYADHLLRTSLYAAEYTRRSTGVNSSRLRLYPDQFLRIPIIVPPAADQRSIVRFIGRLDRLSSRYLRAKQKLVILLEEQKRAIIFQAVTRGLDRAARLASSGVEWLGDVPEHWKVLQLRRVASARCDGPFGSGLTSAHYAEHGVRVIRLQNIGSTEFKDADKAYISPLHYASLGDHSVIRGDLLIAGLGDERNPPGRACVAPDDIEPAMVKADCFRFRLDPCEVDPFFVAFQLTATAIAASAILSTGATRQRINLTSAAYRAIAFPPLAEQTAIIECICKDTAALTAGIKMLHSEISLMREYRTRLISDVVTGNLDVREAASSLPNEDSEMDETLLASDLLEEGDEADLEIDDLEIGHLGEEVAE
jgi:type I restriction enzyme, S subunit